MKELHELNYSNITHPIAINYPGSFDKSVPLVKYYCYPSTYELITLLNQISNSNSQLPLTIDIDCVNLPMQKLKDLSHILVETEVKINEISLHNIETLFYYPMGSHGLRKKAKMDVKESIKDELETFSQIMRFISEKEPEIVKLSVIPLNISEAMGAIFPALTILNCKELSLSSPYNDTDKNSSYLKLMRFNKSLKTLDVSGLEYLKDNNYFTEGIIEGSCWSPSLKIKYSNSAGVKPDNNIYNALYKFSILRLEAIKEALKDSLISKAVFGTFALKFMNDMSNYFPKDITDFILKYMNIPDEISELSDLQPDGMHIMPILGGFELENEWLGAHYAV